jgi:hypothetical protein
MSRQGLAWPCCAIAFLSASLPVRAEIQKIATVDCGSDKVCFYWWPKLPSLHGWHTDQAANFDVGGNGVNTLVPNGWSFHRAPAVIYGEATFKPRYEWQHPSSENLDAFIADYQKATLDEDAHATISDAASLATADGQKLRSITYIRPSQHVWERASYGVEGEYYIVFQLTTYSQREFDRRMPEYERLVSSYRK